MKKATYDETRERPAAYGALRRFWQLLRQDAARRSLRWSVPFALAVGLMIRVGAGRDLDAWEQFPIYGDNPFLVLYFELWLAVLFAVIIAHFNSRCSSLNLGLPISSRQLWIARVIAVAGAALIPIAVLLASTTFADPSRGIGLDVPLLRLGARSAAGFVFAVVMFQLPSPGVCRISGKKSYVAFVALLSAGVLTYTVMTPESWVFTALPLAAALLAGLIVVTRLPVGFRVAGDVGRSARGVEAERRLPTAAEATARSWRKGGRLKRRLRLTGVIWRETLNTWPAWVMVFFVFVAVWAITMSFYHVKHPLGEFVSLMLWSWIFVCQALRRMNRIDYLPVSRAFVFSVVMAAAAIPVGAGLAVGHLEYRLDDTPPTQVCYCDNEVRVPYEAWEVAWGGTPPVVESSWGETHTPHARRLAKFGTSAVVFNPFERAKDSSARFVAMQLDRAVERVHGWDPVRAPVSAVADDTSFVNAIEKGEYNVESSVRRGTELRSRTNAVVLMIWAALFALVNSVWWKRYGPEAAVVKTRWFAILFFGIPYAYLIGLEVLTARGVVDQWALLAFTMIVLRTMAESIPIGTGPLWILTAAVGALCLLVLQRQFAKAEAPAQRSGKHLLSEY